MNDPFLFALRATPSRDERAGGIFLVFFGAFVARALIGTKCGVPGTLGVLAGFRLIQLIWWALLPSPEPKKADK